MALRFALTTLTLAGMGGSLALAGDNVMDSMKLAVEGAATFVANTNVPAVSIKGKSTALKAEVTARRDPQGLHIDRIEAAVPVRTLQTGMALRDEHMRKYIFTTKDGQTPDVTFQAANVNCPAGAQTTCDINGSMTIRGTAHAFTMPLKVKEDGNGFKATGEAVVKLSDFGIEQPTQFGVKTTNEVQVKLDFTARPGKTNLSMAGAGR